MQTTVGHTPVEAEHDMRHTCPTDVQVRQRGMKFLSENKMVAFSTQSTYIHRKRSKIKGHRGHQVGTIT